MSENARTTLVGTVAEPHRGRSTQPRPLDALRPGAAILATRVDERRGHARRLAAPVGKPLRRAAVGLRTRDWAPHSRLFVEQEAAEWVLSYEARQLGRTAAALGIELGPRRWARGVANQSIFHLSQFTLLLHDFRRAGNNLGLAYFHGRPGTPGMPEFDACFEAMRARHGEIDRIQVTNREMEELVLSTGIAPEKVHRIPIGIDIDVFGPRDDAARLAARADSACRPRRSSSARSRRTASVGEKGWSPS